MERFGARRTFRPLEVCIWIVIQKGEAAGREGRNSKALGGLSKQEPVISQSRALLFYLFPPNTRETKQPGAQKKHCGRLGNRGGR